MSASAIWRRLDRPGHDAALLQALGDGWLLQGAAVFAHEAGAAHVAYQVEVDAAWRTKRGEVRGFLGDKTLNHDIRRDRDGWRLNGVTVQGLQHLVDLDYGFTPATNILQIRRVAPPANQEVHIPVVWFDLDDASLTELPQSYERCSESTYWYVAPTVPYQGFIELAPNGFVKSYPGLWRLEV